MTKYSGRTSVLEHKNENWKEFKGEIPSAITRSIVFEAQWSDCPIEVYEEITRLWRDLEFGNDNYYYKWDDAEDGKNYPIISEYLLSKKIKTCLIHFWW